MGDVSVGRPSASCPLSRTGIDSRQAGATIKQVDCAFRERSADTLVRLDDNPQRARVPALPHPPGPTHPPAEERRPASLAPKGLATFTQYEILKFPIRPIRPFGISRGSGVPPVPVQPKAGNPAGFSKSEFLTESEDPDFLRGRTRRGRRQSRLPLRPSGRSRKRSTTSLHCPSPIWK
jgi:hypothetical protein